MDLQDVLVNTILVFVGLAGGYALSEIKELQNKKNMNKKTKNMVLYDVTKIREADTWEPLIPRTTVKLEIKNDVKKLINRERKIDEVILNYHQRFDFSFWKGMLLSGALLELKGDFFQVHWAFYDEVEKNVNDMKAAYDKAKLVIGKNLELETPNEFKMELDLGEYYTAIYSRFNAITEITDELPYDIHEKLDHEISSGRATINWSNLNTKLILKYTNKWTELGNDK